LEMIGNKKKKRKVFTMIGSWTPRRRRWKPGKKIAVSLFCEENECEKYIHSFLINYIYNLIFAYK
jgi:hypothetical protein